MTVPKSSFTDSRCRVAERTRNLRGSSLGGMLLAGMQPVVETVSGSYPSPTLLINGIDVATGRPPTDQVCCRLDVPTREQIVTALQKAGR